MIHNAARQQSNTGKKKYLVLFGNDSPTPPLLSLSPLPATLSLRLPPQKTETIKEEFLLSQ